MDSDYKKTIAITLAETFIARNIFYTTFWKEFLKNNRDNNIIILVKKDKEEYYRSIFEAPHSHIRVEGVEAHIDNPLSKFLGYLMHNGINTHTNRWEKERAALMSTSKRTIITTIKDVYTRIFGAIDLYKRFLRKLFVQYGVTSNDVQNFFNSHSIETLVLTSLTNFDHDVVIGLEAKKRGIKTIGMPRSWDNFTSHGLIRVMPDHLIVQNEYLKDMAYAYQAVKATTHIDVVGLPHYDIYKEASKHIISREDFFSKCGLDPEKKLMVYCAMGEFLFPHEHYVADELESIIQSGILNESVQVLYRAHPRFISNLSKMKDMKHIVPDPIAKHVGKDQAGQEIDYAETQHLINTLYHMDMMVTGASTMAVEAVAFDKPVVCIGYDCGQEVDYWYSIERFYDTYTHFEAFMETHAAKLAKSREDLGIYIKEYLENDRKDYELRQKAQALFLDPFDGSAGLRLARVIQGYIVE